MKVHHEILGIVKSSFALSFPNIICTCSCQPLVCVCVCVCVDQWTFNNLNITTISWWSKLMTQSHCMCNPVLNNRTFTLTPLTRVTRHDRIDPNLYSWILKICCVIVFALYGHNRNNRGYEWISMHQLRYQASRYDKWVGMEMILFLGPIYIVGSWNM